MLMKPQLRLCAPPHNAARSHPTSGPPEQWLSDQHLSPLNLSGVSFDFFVNWQTWTVADELWVKRVVVRPPDSWQFQDSDQLASAIYECDGKAAVARLCQFAARYGMSCHYFLLGSSANWDAAPAPIVELSFDATGRPLRSTVLPLAVLKNRIKALSGGPVMVGRKGLIYGTTSLECYLSKTDAAWPGDCDLLLLDANLNALAIVEFKKHNLQTPIAQQTLANYYPRPDGRKYDRLALLRDRLARPTAPPLVILFYSTRAEEPQIKLERLQGAARQLVAANSLLLPLPQAGNAQSCIAFARSLLQVIRA